MPRTTDVRPAAASLYLLPVRTRMPLKFGPETLTEVTCARVKLTVEDRRGRRAEGWGETPLSVQWAWPSRLTVAERYEAMVGFCRSLNRSWASDVQSFGHAMEIGHEFIDIHLSELHGREFEAEKLPAEPMPWLAALICNSAFDLALHDAYGVLNGVPTYQTYTSEFMNADLSTYLGDPELFRGRYPADFFADPVPTSLPAWHLVGGKDPIDAAELTGEEPRDGYPVLLRDWIERDGLTSLKVKLRGDDGEWDYNRMVKVGQIANETGAEAISADFNCTVREPDYVNAILDRLRLEQPWVFEHLLYVEQPFPHDLEANLIDVHSVSARNPLFLDESAHDWRFIKLGQSLGWTGVALKTCKTQTGALLSLCWAKAHGMALMVQDLTNPMLAQIPHVLLAAHAGTIRGVETNAMQFYPEASRPEEAVHPGLYRRRQGRVDFSTVGGDGFGYRLDRIGRTLPAPVTVSE
ncbi:MAG: enolase superfamily enzyme related to L-alanine-DL-glutamate epimerase [Planctomycetota bacterium]|nr:enolase superfamily enzyme related to L-alanine-DL-glutamate epimerase [Planctomycetota bacterium]